MPDNSQNPEIKEQVSLDELSKKIQETNNELDQLKNGLNSLSLQEQAQKLSEIETALLEYSEDLANLEISGAVSIDQKELNDLKSKVDILKSQKESLKKQIEAQTKLAINELNQTVTQNQAPEQGEKKGAKTNGTEKNWLGRQRESLTSKQERKEHTGTNILRALGGIGAVAGVWKLGKRIFGGKDYESEIPGYSKMSRKEKRRARQALKQRKRAENSKKPFRDRRYGKALKRSLIGTSIYYVGKWLITGHNSFSKEKKDGPSTTPGSKIEKSEKAFENLSQEDKEIYNSSADAINEYMANITGDQNGSQQVEDMMGDSKFDSDKKGLVPFILSNRYASLDKMLSETSFYYEIIGTEGHIARNKLKDWGVDGLKTLLTPLVGVVNGLTFDLLNLDEGRDKLIEKLKSIEGLEEQLRTIFRKSITVMSYYQSRKGALESQLAEQELTKQNPKFATLSDDEKVEEIADYLQNDERYNQYIKPEVSKFMKLNIKDATVYLQERNLLNGELDLQMKKSMEKVDKRRKDLLNIEDDDDESILDDIKNELNNGKLSEKAQKKLNNLCEDFEEEIEGFGRKSRWNKYLPILEMFDLDEDTLEKILATGGYDEAISVYKKDLNNIRERSEKGTLTEHDLENFESSINDYYKFQKSLLSQSINLSESRDENGNVVLRWVDKVYYSGKETAREVKVLIKGDMRDKMKAGGKIVGGLVSIDLLTYPIRFVTQGVHGRLASSPTVKVLWKGVVKPSAKLGAFVIGRVTGNAIRANLGGIAPARAYTEDTLRIAIARGDVSLNRAVKIASKNKFKVSLAPNSATIQNKVDLMKRMFNLPDGEASRLVNIVDKFGDNPNIYKKLMKYKYDWNKYTSRRTPTDWFHLDRSKKLFKIDTNALARLENIATRVDNLPAGTQKTVMQSMMRSVKSLDQAENIAKIGVGSDITELLKSGKFMKAEEYGKYLARYASEVGQLDSLNMRMFESFIIRAKNEGKIGSNVNLFVRNSMKNIAKIKNEGFAIENVERLSLNSSKWSKLAESTKANCAKMANRLKKMANNPKFNPFKKSLVSKATAMDDFGKTITPEGMKAVKNMSLFGKETAFAKLSTQGMHELSRLSSMLRNVDMAKDLTKALKSANTLDNVKDILRQQGIVVNHIDDAVLLKIAKSGNAKRINDIVNYGAGFNTVKGMQKLLSNPIIKQVGRITGRAFIVADFAFVGYNFYSQFNEVQEIKKINQERGEWKESQSYFDLAMGGIGAVAGACMLIPGYGWIAGGVLFASMAVMEVGNKYYKDIEKFKQNQADFLSKGIAATKQELTSIDSRDQGLSRTWFDKMDMFGSETKKQLGSPKTKAEALKALIKMEELQKNPLAGADLNDPEVIKDPELVEAIRILKQNVEDIVEKRFNYFKTNYLDQNKPLVKKDKHEENQAISEIESLLEKSTINYVMEMDDSYTGEKTPDKYREFTLKKLKEGNEGNFAKLEKLYEENQTSLFQMYAELPYYKSMLIQFGDEDQQNLINSCNYFEQYMNYKMMGKPITSYPYINIDPENIDYNPIHNLLSHFALIPTVLDSNEAKNYQRLSDEEILDKYGISGILGQDILYECAKLLNYDGKNSLEELKYFFNESQKDVNGFYFDIKKQYRTINEDWARDDKFATDSELNSLETIERMRRYINANVNKSGSGKMFTESSQVNQEIGNKMLKIIDDYISLRKSNLNTGIVEYIKTHNPSQGYIALPYHLIIKARKAGRKGAGEHLYRFEKGKIITI